MVVVVCVCVWGGGGGRGGGGDFRIFLVFKPAFNLFVTSLATVYTA